MNFKTNFITNFPQMTILLGLSLLLISCDMKEMSYQMRYNRARNLHDHGKYAEAIEIYKKVLEETSDNTEVIYDLGVAYAENHDIVNAKKQIAVLKKLDRRDLAEVLASVIETSRSGHALEKRQSDHETKKQGEKD